MMTMTPLAQRVAEAGGLAEVMALINEELALARDARKAVDSATWQAAMEPKRGALSGGAART
jgi:hypothetical protein